MFERFTDRARRALVLAQEEARLLGHGFIGTEHVLLGLVREEDGIAAKVLETLEVSADEVRRRVEEIIGVPGSPTTGNPPFTPRTKKVLELSLREALALGHNYIGTEHLLLGLIREGQGVASQVLRDMGVEGDLVRRHVLELLGNPPRRKAAGGGGITLSGRSVRRRARAQLVSCSFCGRQPPQSGRLVSSGGAAICEHCIAEWSERLRSDSDVPGTSSRPTTELIDPDDGQGEDEDDE